MFQERRDLLAEIYDHYESLANQLKVKTMVDKETMINCCPTTDELINIGIPGETCGQDQQVYREVDPVTGDTKITIKRDPRLDDWDYHRD